MNLQLSQTVSLARPFPPSGNCASRNAVAHQVARGNRARLQEQFEFEGEG